MSVAWMSAAWHDEPRNDPVVPVKFTSTVSTPELVTLKIVPEPLLPPVDAVP